MLGVHHQVLCVTHLPQVAAQAHNHLQVQKQTDGNTTRTGIERLTQAQRVDEIARMLGGQKITDSTLQHAQEMLLMAPRKATRPGSVRTDTACTPDQSLFSDLEFGAILAGAVAVDNQ